MKNLAILVAFAALFFAACDNNHDHAAHEGAKPAAPAQPEPAATAAPSPATETVYACPMHPEITGKAGDKCSKCKMDLKPIEPAAAEVYACPMHPEVTGKAGDKCPKCKMDLKPVKK